MKVVLAVLSMVLFSMCTENPKEIERKNEKNLPEYKNKVNKVISPAIDCMRVLPGTSSDRRGNI
jgi:hypothetical protein